MAIKDDRLEQDPVCRMVKPREQFKFFVEYLGEKYYFCSENCRHMFSEMPRGYVGDPPPSASWRTSAGQGREQ